MDILFKRAQGTNSKGKVNFKLWGKVELDDDETAIVKRYKFDEAILVDADQQGLLRKSIFVGFGAAVVGFLLTYPNDMGALLSIIAGIVAGYFWYDRHRETIFVKDLLHGRHFVCDSVIELAQKEVRIGNIVATFRQVMESAKHWDGTERHTVEALSPADARQLIARGF